MSYTFERTVGPQKILPESIFLQKQQTIWQREEWSFYYLQVLRREGFAKYNKGFTKFQIFFDFEKINKTKMEMGGHVFVIAYILCSSWFYEAFCVLWMTYDHLYYAHCLACRAIFGSLVPAMCNRTSYAQVHGLPQSHWSDNREGTLFSWLNIYYAHLDFVKFEHSVYCVSLITIYIMPLA